MQRAASPATSLSGRRHPLSSLPATGGDETPSGPMAHDYADSGDVGAACVWKTPMGWTGLRFHLGVNKEVLDSEVYAIYRALCTFDRRQESGRRHQIR